MSGILKDLTTLPLLRKNKQLYKEWNIFLKSYKQKMENKSMHISLQKGAYKLRP